MIAECDAYETPPAPPRHHANAAAMTDLSAEFKALAEYRPTHKVRFVTAA